MTTTTTTTINFSQLTTITPCIVVAMVVDYFLWFHSDCSYYIALEKASRPKHGRGLVGGQSLLDKLFYTRIHKLFAPLQGLHQQKGQSLR